VTAPSPLRAVLEAEGGLKDLTVLAPQNDPFRRDTSAGHRDGRWLAERAAELGLATGRATSAVCTTCCDDRRGGPAKGQQCAKPNPQPQEESSMTAISRNCFEAELELFELRWKRDAARDLVDACGGDDWRSALVSFVMDKLDLDDEMGGYLWDLVAHAEFIDYLADAESVCPEPGVQWTPSEYGWQIYSCYLEEQAHNKAGEMKRLVDGDESF
jgi:hypothetical protein